MPRRRFTQEQLDDMATMRERGWSYNRIGSKLGMSANAVSWHCLRLCAEPPRPSKLGPIPTAPSVVARGNHLVRRFTQSDDAKLLQLEAEGLSISEIARRIGRRWNSTRGRLMTLARREERAERA
jgi:transcriptional regulator